MSIFSNDSALRRKMAELDKSLTGSFNKIKNEFSDHLEAINENTNELQAHYEYLTELDNKIDKLNEKLEEVQMMLKQMSTQSKFVLSKQEQKVFVTLYTLGEQGALSCTDISSRLNTTELSVKNALTSIMKKGIPIIEEKIDDRIFYKLTKEFRISQAKEHIVKIDEELLQEVC